MRLVFFTLLFFTLRVSGQVCLWNPSKEATLHGVVGKPVHIYVESLTHSFYGSLFMWKLDRVNLAVYQYKSDPTPHFVEDETPSTRVIASSKYINKNKSVHSLTIKALSASDHGKQVILQREGCSVNTEESWPITLSVSSCDPSVFGMDATAVTRGSDVKYTDEVVFICNKTMYQDTYFTAVCQTNSTWNIMQHTCKPKPNQLNGGAIAGIVMGTLLVFVAALFGIIAIIRKLQRPGQREVKRQTPQYETKTEKSTPLMKRSSATGDTFSKTSDKNTNFGVKNKKCEREAETSDSGKTEISFSNKRSATDDACLEARNEEDEKVSEKSETTNATAEVELTTFFSPGSVTNDACLEARYEENENFSEKSKTTNATAEGELTPVLSPRSPADDTFLERTDQQKLNLDMITGEANKTTDIKSAAADTSFGRIKPLLNKEDEKEADECDANETTSGKELTSLSNSSSLVLQRSTPDVIFTQDAETENYEEETKRKESLSFISKPLEGRDTSLCSEEEFSGAFSKEQPRVQKTESILLSIAEYCAHFECNEDESKRAIRDLDKLLSDVRDVIDTSNDLINDKFYYRALILLRIASDMYKSDTSLPPNDILEGIFECVCKTACVVNKIICANDESCSNAFCYGMKNMKEIADDLRAVADADPYKKAEYYASCMGEIGLRSEKEQESLRYYKKGLEYLIAQFGERVPKCSIYKSLLKKKCK